MSFLSGYKLSEIRNGEDAVNPLPDRVTVPLFQKNALYVDVELGGSDECGMRAAYLRHDEMSPPIQVGYIGPGEGRWVLRDLVLAELMGRFRNRPECADQPCPYEKLWTAASMQGVADTWDLIVHGRCHEHWNKYELASNNDDDDLIPAL